MSGVAVADRLRAVGSDLTVTERRIAEVVLGSPQTVAFGTVASVANAAGAGTATVVRLATKLGYDGWAALQRSVQDELTNRLGPAAQRIRAIDDDAVVARHGDAEHRNLTGTFEALDPAVVRDVVAALHDPGRPVLVLSGSASRGVALQFVHDLGHLRAGISLLDGNQIDVLQAVALAEDTAIVVAIDLRRYDQWVLDTLDVVAARGLAIVAISDSAVSPLALRATHSFVVAADSVGPFDSHVGTLALLDLLVVEVARTGRALATDRLDRLEAAWADHDALAD